jgi:ribosomal protein S18 acetylase RimI-like enzyme
MRLNDPILNLRPEIEQDGEFLARLYRSTREDLLQLNLAEAMLDQLVEMQFRAQQTGYRNHFPDARHVIIEKQGEPIGCTITHHGADLIRLVYLAFLPHERNRGYGRSVIQVLQSEAANAKKPITLSVATQNWQAQRLYVSSGFRPVNIDGANLEMIWLRNVTRQASTAK